MTASLRTLAAAIGLLTTGASAGVPAFAQKQGGPVTFSASPGASLAECVRRGAAGQAEA